MPAAACARLDQCAEQQRLRDAGQCAAHGASAAENVFSPARIGPSNVSAFQGIDAEVAAFRGQFANRPSVDDDDSADDRVDVFFADR